MELITFETNLAEPQTILPIFNDLNLHLNDNIYLVGDLHGSFIKLLSVLIHFNFITYYDDPMYVHYSVMQQFHVFQKYAYESTEKSPFPDIVYHFLNKNFQINSEQFKNKKIIFLGDTLCDRGPSDFITLLIFDWMTQHEIEYSGLIGNHEFTICMAHLLSDEFDLNSENYIRHQYDCYHSFDYHKLNPQYKNLFTLLLFNYFKKLTLFKKLLTPTQILLTHAPCTKESFETLSEFTAHCTDQSFDERVRDLFIKGSENKTNALSPNDLKCLHTIYKFCSNRKTITPFFHSQNEGLNIFGHMSGFFRSIQKKHTQLSSTQLCIDRCTGMPKIYTGQIAYVVL